ncbi:MULTISPECIES: GIN domain-containing protein [Myroides]|uniref:GIN domain-containing protein n=1 Tax=Myroides TaxID=76831 RepID=UPI001302FD16|nr:DUF2807 domain-containing protein [Myroides phaeus]
MKKLVMFFLLVGSSVFAQVKETRQVSDFDNVKASQGIRVEFTYGEPKSVVVDAEDQELLDRVKTEVNANGRLSVYIESKVSRKRNKVVYMGSNGKSVVVTIHNPKLEGVQVSSSARFNLVNEAKAKHFSVTASSSGRYEGALVKADDLTIEGSSSAKIGGSFTVMSNASLSASSSSSVEVSLTSKKASFGVSSSGKITASGKANEVNASASSSGNIKAREFATKTLDGRASSSGSMIFTVSDEVVGRASSSGRVQYVGDVQKVNVSTSSSGSVKRVE